MVNIAVLVSGGGTNLQAIIDAERRGKIKNGRITAVISSKEGVFALKRAQEAGIPSYILPRGDYKSKESYDGALSDLLEKTKSDLIVLAGFMLVLSPEFCEKYKNRIINVHPALIPSFCGDGYYGIHVHEAAIKKGVKVSGATVHFVNEITDGGPIILQKAVCVFDDDSPETLQKRVMREAEWEILPEAVSLFCEGRLKIKGNRVIILKGVTDE